MSFTLGWALPKMKFIMKSLPLLLAIPIFLLGFCSSSITVSAQMKSVFDFERGDCSPTSVPMPYDNAGIGPYSAEEDSKIFKHQLGSAFLGIDAKTYAPDSFSKSGDAKLNRIVIFDIGFHF